MNASQFMDKQIMDLSNSSQSNNNEFISFMDPREDHHHVSGGVGDKNEEILPNYDFQPIRPIVTSSSPPSDSSKVAAVAAAHRTWNSADNKSSPRNYSSSNSFEHSKVILEKDHNAVDPTLVSEIDRTVKKYADNLLHSLDGISARLSQLESRTRHLEHSVDELKVSVGNNHGSSDGRMRQLENILREVQDGVQVVRDKQEILDAHLQLAKLQSSKVGEHPDNQSAPHLDSSQPAISAPQQSHQQPPTVPFTQPPPSLPPNAPPPPPSQQNLLPQVQPQNQFSPNPVPSVPQQEPYFPPPGQAPEIVGQHYQVPPPPQIQHSSPAPPQQQYPPPQPQYSQPPSPPQQQPPGLAGNLPQQQPPLGHHHEESPYAQPPSYPPSHIRQSSSHPPTASPPPQQFYGAPSSNVYDGPPSSRPGPGFSAPYGPSSCSPEPYPYSSSPSQYGSSFPMKPHQVSSPAMGHSGGSSYPQLPTARLLPHALPTAAGVGGGSGSSGSGNRVPIDDVVDKVTSMGFSREQVGATVRKLTDNGQSVDLNVVLDTLMNDSDVQPPRGWYGR